VPEATFLSQETLGRIKAAIEDLPPKHREVMVLRDVVQLEAGQVEEMLGISAENQRVRLHRARAAVRKALEEYLA
jgi:RNA polymerase sigma-70 factor (ECF subfamily)